MSDKSHMTPVQKVIAYSAILTGILAVLLAFGSSIHVAYHVFTSTGFTTTAVNIKDPLIINSSLVVDVSQWNTNFVKVLAIGGGGRGGGGGGGSGYISHGAIPITGTGQLTVTIGAGGTSRVDGGPTTVTNSDGMTVAASGGQQGGREGDGGSGWSGGGASPGGSGGYNGGDGQDRSKGSGGSGQKTALPIIPGVILVPGARGIAACSGCSGAGGGGIIINGEGIRDGDKTSQGYGAGGGSASSYKGQSGAVIIYI